MALACPVEQIRHLGVRCGAVVEVLDARARRRVPARLQLTPHLSEYVPAMVVMTHCRTPPVDLKLTFGGIFSGQLPRLVDTTNPTGTMLDIVSPGRVHVEALIAEQHDMGVCDAIEKFEQFETLLNTTQQSAAFQPTKRPDQGF